MRPVGSRSKAELAALPLAVVTLLLSLSALGHGGEDHGAPPPAPVSTDAGMRTASASTSAVELVARWPAVPVGTPLPFRVLLSDFTTNAPIEAAEVTLDISDAQGQALPSLGMKATASPGIYAASVTPRVSAVHAASIAVVAGDIVDVVALPALPFGSPSASTDGPEEHDGVSGVAGHDVLGGLASAALLIVVLLVRRHRHHRRRRLAAAAAVGLSGALFVGMPANAHGGEDHGAEDHGAPAVATSVATSTSVVVLQKESQFLLGIRTALVELAPVKDRLEVPGVVTAPPERHAALFAPQQGRVILGDGGKGIPLLGSTVQRGQVLAVLEAALSVGERASFAVQAAQAESEVTAAHARLGAAERGLARIKSLEGVVSQRDRDAAAVEVEQAQASFAAAEAKRSAYGSTERSTRMVLQAPISGILADVDISPGEIIEPGRRAFLVVDPAELWVEAKVYEADLARLTPGASANINVDAWPGQTFPGALMALGEVVDADTRTVKAIFRVSNPDRRLKLGMFAHVQIGAGASSDVLVVPDSAILDVDGRQIVFVHVAPEMFERREVVMGRRDGTRVEVRGGVGSGDRVVTSGLLTLKNAPPAPAKSTKPTASTAEH